MTTIYRVAGEMCRERNQCSTSRHVYLSEGAGTWPATQGNVLAALSNLRERKFIRGRRLGAFAGVLSHSAGKPWHPDGRHGQDAGEQMHIVQQAKCICCGRDSSHWVAKAEVAVCTAAGKLVKALLVALTFKLSTRSQLKAFRFKHFSLFLKSQLANLNNSNIMGFFDKLFGKKESDQPSSLNQPVSEAKKERAGYVNVGQSIYPVIKDANDPKLKLVPNNPVIAEPIADGIVVCYLLDFGDNFEMLSASHLTKFGLTIDDVRKVAIRNLANKVNNNCKIAQMDFSAQMPGVKPFFRIEMDPNLNPSMMLLDEFWDKNAKEIVKSDTIAVTIPAKNLIFFSDMKLMESFRTMRPVAEQMYQSSIPDGIALSQNTYIWKNGKWILFLDTEEQMEALW